MIKEAPEYIYKFRSFDTQGYWKNLLINNEIYFPSPAKLNDPFDSRIPIRYLSGGSESQVRKYFRDVCIAMKEDIMTRPNVTSESEFENYCQNFIEELVGIKQTQDVEKIEHMENAITFLYNNTYGVFSSSFDSPDNNALDSLLQWAHYTDKYSGFCVKFNTKKLLESVEGFCDSPSNMVKFIGSGDVVYSDVYPRISPYGFKEDIRPLSDQEHLTLKLIKSNHWKYENEYRIILMFENDMPRSIKIADDAIESIYLGLQIRPENKKLLMDMLTEKNTNIKIFQTMFRPNHFGVKFVEEFVTK